MPYRDAERRRSYGRTWIAARRDAFFADKSCVDCGSTERLELDHLDPALKVHHAIWSWSPPRRAAEIAKCVVRCHDCHVARHAEERRIEHSTGGYKRGCRCEVCCEAKRACNERYQLRRGRESNAPGRLCRPLPSHSATPPIVAPYRKDPVMTERLLMAIRGDGEHQESEPVVVSTEQPGRVVLRLDNGDRLDFDVRELVDAAVDRVAA